MTKKIQALYREKKSFDAFYAWDRGLEERDLMGIGNLSEIRELWLNNNKLQSVPTEVTELTRLKYLELSCNELRYLPLELSRLTNLQHLGVFDNADLLFPPRAVMERANACVDLSRLEWEKLGFPRTKVDVVLNYLESKEAEQCFSVLFPIAPPSTFSKDIAALFY